MPKITILGGPSDAAAQADSPKEISPGVYEVSDEPTVEEPQLVEVPKAYDEWAFTDLRTEARERGLASGGTADDLRARLKDADGITDEPEPEKDEL